MLTNPLHWRPNFMSTYHGVNACVLNVKAVVATFNQEKSLIGAFSVIVQRHRLIVYSTSLGVSVSGVSVAGLASSAWSRAV